MMKIPFRALLLMTAGAAIALVAAKVAQPPAPPLLDRLQVDASAPARDTPLAGFATIVETAAPSVVSITSSSFVPIGRDWSSGSIVGKTVPGGLGSGVIISADGHILTNVHVISQQGRVMDQVFVHLSDGTQYKAKVVGVDPDSDVAVLDIDADNLPAAVIGDSDQLLPGDTVLAIGSPFGLSNTVTKGIVSALGRNNLNITSDEEFIQTDASINPGNSGGALVDHQGRLVGINTAIFSRTGGNVGIGFAIPITKAIDIADQLVTKGHVSRAYLGILPWELNEQIVRSAREQGYDLPPEGILVAEVITGTPAQHFGLRDLDVILAVNDKKVRKLGNFLRTIASFEPGETVQLKILRAQKEQVLEVTLGDRHNHLSR